MKWLFDHPLKSFIAFRKIVVNSILATDMSLHDEYVQKITEQSQRLNHIDPSDSTNCEKEKIILCASDALHLRDSGLRSEVYVNVFTNNCVTI